MPESSKKRAPKRETRSDPVDAVMHHDVPDLLCLQLILCRALGRGGLGGRGGCGDAHAVDAVRERTEVLRHVELIVHPAAAEAQPNPGTRRPIPPARARLF